MYHTVCYFNGENYQTASFNNLKSAMRFRILLETAGVSGVAIQTHAGILTAHLAG